MNNGLEKLHAFLKDLDVCMDDIRDYLPILIEKARNGEMSQSIGSPIVFIDNDELTIHMTSNMISFCETSHRLEAVICYYAIYHFVVDLSSCDEEDGDNISSALLEALQDNESWWQRLLKRLFNRRDIVFEYATKFLQGKNLAHTYNSLID